MTLQKAWVLGICCLGGLVSAVGQIYLAGIAFGAAALAVCVVAICETE